LKPYESAVIHGLDEILSAGANLSRVLEHLKTSDCAFITAEVSENENKRLNKNLSEELQALGYGFINIKGNYNAPEDTSMVINTIEDQQMFFEDMIALAGKFYQDSILFYPVGETPYRVFTKSGKKEMFTSKDPTLLAEEIGEYFTKIKGHTFNFELDSAVRLAQRSGYIAAKPVNYRIEFRMAELIESSGLARPYRLKGSVALISASREYWTQEENIILNEELKESIRRYCLGFVPLEGEWEEEGKAKQCDISFAVYQRYLSKEDLIAIVLTLVSPYDQ
jgi:hypothetical protein